MRNGVFHRPSIHVKKFGSFLEFQVEKVYVVFFFAAKTGSNDPGQNRSKPSKISQTALVRPFDILWSPEF